MENLTIIIPSNNRPFFLRRSINYWNNYNFPVIIVDGSDETQKKWVDKNSNRNIQYLYKKTPFPDRLNFAAKAIKTKYCILISDDEFYCASALEKCVNFLEKNKEYVAVNGCAIGFSYTKNTTVGFVFNKWRGRMRIEEDPMARMLLHMKNYANPLGVSVTKTALWSKCANLYANHDFPIYALWELEMNLILSFAGKSKTLDMLMYFRSFEKGSPPIRNNIQSLDVKNKINFFWEDLKFNQQKSNFVNILSKELASLETGYNLDYCKNAVTSALDSYCKFNKKKKQHWVIHKIYSIFPISIKEKLKNIFISHVKLIDVIKKIQKEGVYVNYHDVKIIKDLITYFYNNNKI